MTEVFCHRGYSGLYPENTMLAFRKAVETGADGIELDVHLTKDGQVVIIHDELLDRTTNGTGFVKDRTLRELRQLDASMGKSEPQRIPTLEEYFRLVAPTGMKTNIELKTGTFDYDGLEEKVWAIVRAFHQEDRVIFSSFHAQTLLRMKQVAPQAPCGLLNRDKLPNAGRVVRDLGLEAYHPLCFRLRPAVVRDLKDHGLAINTYTPNAHAMLAYLLAQGVSAVITNYPERAMKLRSIFQGEKD